MEFIVQNYYALKVIVGYIILGSMIILIFAELSVLVSQKVEFATLSWQTCTEQIIKVSMINILIATPIFRMDQHSTTSF